MEQTAQVFDIRQARSYVSDSHVRWVNMPALCKHLSISRGAARNYALGYYWKDAERVYYDCGPMPSKLLPGGQRRFNVDEVERWLDSLAQSQES